MGIRNITFIVLLSLGGIAYGQDRVDPDTFADFKISVDSLDPSQLQDIEYRGECVEAISWKDKAGEHYLLLTETGEEESDEEGHRNAFVWGHHYLKTEAGLKKIWTFTDFVEECPLDIVAEFIKPAMQITDLDKDGHAEIWLVYQLACSGDISPSELHIVMYKEHSDRLEMKGEGRLLLPDGEEIGGIYVLDAEFEGLPEIFSQYAIWLWDRYVAEDPL